MSLFWRVFLANAVTLGVAGVILVLSPATVSDPVSYVETLTVIGGILAMFAVNAVMLRRATLPLRQLRRSIEDLRAPTSTQPVPTVRSRDDVGMLTDAYRQMLGRLAEEREQSVRRSISAQESERSRVSRELHDEVGQSITVLLLRLGVLREQAPEELRGEVDEVTEALRSTLEDVRSISSRLRPGVLEDLGLRSALRALVREAGAHSRLATRAEIDDLPALTTEQELVIYRIAQEAVTNVLRHSGAETLTLELRRDTDRLRLVVRDDGAGSEVSPGLGVSGMRERARVVHGRLSISSVPGTGTTVELSMPYRSEGERG